MLHVIVTPRYLWVWVVCLRKWACYLIHSDPIYIYSTVYFPNCFVINGHHYTVVFTNGILFQKNLQANARYSTDRVFQWWLLTDLFRSFVLLLVNVYNWDNNYTHLQAIHTQLSNVYHWLTVAVLCHCWQTSSSVWRLDHASRCTQSSVNGHFLAA